MDASAYGRLVHRGGYATGGIVHNHELTIVGTGCPVTYFLVGEHGPELAPFRNGRLDLGRMFRRDPDDGAAGVRAMV